MSQSQVQLHLIQNQLSFAAFEQQFLRVVADGDSLLFLNDSVFVLLQEDFNSDRFTELCAQLSVFIIDEHIEARGISTLISSHIKTISYQEFVEQCQKATKVVSW